MVEGNASNFVLQLSADAMYDLQNIGRYSAHGKLRKASQRLSKRAETQRIGRDMHRNITLRRYSNGLFVGGDLRYVGGGVLLHHRRRQNKPPKI